MTPTRGRASWVALLVLAAGWGGAAMFGWTPAPAHAQSGIDFTVEVASTTATVTANTGVPNELVSLKLWYRDERDRIIECGDSGADVEVELTTDAQGTLSYASTDPAVTETYGATGCLTLRGIEHWASSEPLFSISPPFSEIALRVGLPTQPITINYRGDASNRYTLEAAQGATITVADSTYAAGRAYAFRESGEPLAAGSITMTLTPSKTSNVGFTVRRDAAPLRGHALTVSRHIPAGKPAPTPTVWPEFASEVDLRVEGGPGQIVATFEMCCHRTYLLELRDIRTQAKLLQWSYVSTANGQQYIAPPAVFGNLDAGTEYGICLYVVDRLTGSPGSRSTYSGNYLCSTATTNFPTPTPPVPTPTTRVELEATVTPTPLPAAVPANLFRTPTPVGGVVRTPTPAPTAQPPPLPTPTPWGETLFYTNTVPNWEAAPQVAETADGKVEIRVQWTGVAEADYYELLITDGRTVGRTEETNGAVERTHSWRAPASSDASRVRVRAVQKGAPYSATVSNVDNNRVVIPSGQSAYSPFSGEQLISTNITSMVPEFVPTKHGDGTGNAAQRHGGQLGGFGFWIAERLGTGAHWTGWAFAQALWLLACVAVMAAVIGGVGKATGGAVGPWPFAGGAFFFFAMWSGLGGEMAGLELPERFLPLVLVGFMGFILVRGRGWLG